MGIDDGDDIIRSADLVEEASEPVGTKKATTKKVATKKVAGTKKGGK